MSIFRVAKGTWGLSPCIIAYYYKCCIVPLLTWGCMVLGRTCKYKTIQNKLKSFQRQALKIMGPLRPSTPTRGLEIMNYIRPLELEIRKLSAEAYLRTQSTNKIDEKDIYTKQITQKGHRQWCKDYLQIIGYPYLETPMDVCICKWMWQNNTPLISPIPIRRVKTSGSHVRTHIFKSIRTDLKSGTRHQTYLVS